MTSTTIKKLLENSSGIITSKEVTEAGLHRSILTKLVEKGKLHRVSRGVYMTREAWEDEMYFLQYRYSKGIYSHETALYLHSMTDRTPLTFSMTFPKGYNSPSIKKTNVNVYRVTKNNYKLGITDLLSNYGNHLKVYDIERTLCDILRGNYSTDIQIVNLAMKQYVSSKSKDVQKLLVYADQLRVKSRVFRYLEVLL